MAIYLKEFSTHQEYDAYINGSGAILPNVSICTTEGDVHYNPYVDPCASEKVKTTYEWVEIGGVKWATKNVGAKTITDYGQYFSWGGVNGFTADQVSGSCHSKAFSWADYELGSGSSASDITKYNSTDGKTVLESVDDAATANMGSGWRMPTEADFQALSAATTNAWTSITVDNVTVSGRMFTDKTDASKTLFFPAAGYCHDGSVSGVGSYGRYWSSSLSASDAVDGRYLSFYSGGCGMNYYDGRRRGNSVRGVFVD